ncbi:MAG: DUF3276 family protein [Bacteroidales bacterium]
MDSEDTVKHETQERNGDDIFSTPVRAGKRTYFFDVKATKGGDYYLTITESKRRIEKDGRYVYDKHKIFLYKEDFNKFSDGLKESVDFIRANCPIPERHFESHDFEPSIQDKTSSTSSTKVDETPNFSDVDFDQL